MRTLFAVFLVAHGLIHAAYLSPVPPGAKEWPFVLTRTWLVPGMDGSAVKPVGLALAFVAVVGLAAAGLGLLGVPLLTAAWQALAVVGAGASLLLLLLFWHPWLVLGVVISALLLYTLAAAHWPPAAFGVP